METKVKKRVVEEPKEHYKMFKDGKQWVISGIVVFSAGAVFTIVNPAVSADTTQDTGTSSTTELVKSSKSAIDTDTQVQDQSDTNTNSETVVDQSTYQASEKSQSDSRVAVTTKKETNQTNQVEEKAASEISTETSNQDAESTTTDVQADENVQGEDVASKQLQSDKAADTTQSSQVDPTESIDQSSTAQDHVKGNVAAAWEQGYKGQGMVVAVIDSGIDSTHQDFRLTDDTTGEITKEEAESKIAQLGYGTYISPKFPFVYNYVSQDNDWLENDETAHGAHVSGIIAANGQPNKNGDVYTVGVAPEAQLLEMRVFAQFADEKPDDIAKAIHDAVALGANVIQMSLGIGAPDQQLTDIEQQAVQYAVDHGVFVSISASNNGNSGSIITDNNGNPGSNQLAYSPVNSSTIADPGVANNAMTVAAENSAVGDEDDMASFSSWGPLSDYALKPDISAPGVDIVSTVNNGLHQSMSGTSMAGPYNAGAALLVMQKLKATTNLQGADLVKATKLALMNTATPMKDNAYGALVSPRRQGAGEINVGNATANEVIAAGNNNTGSVSLYTVGEKTIFDVTFTNLGDQAQTYTFNDFGGPMTELQAEDGTAYDAYLAGASVSAAQTQITVDAHATKTLSFTLSLAGLKENEPVEGFLGFTSDTEGVPDLVVPYLGYYGDLTDEQVFDSSANQEDSIFSGNYFVNEENYPRGIADENSLKTLVNLEGNYDWSQVAKLYQDGKVAFSPNDDQQSDILKPYEFIKQNLQDLTIQILDADGNVVRTLANEKGIQKSFYPDGGSGNQDVTLSPSMRNDPTALDWDGTLFDQTTNQSVVAPDGEYEYKFVGTLVVDGAQKSQSASYPVIIDTTAPVITNVSYDAQNQILSADFSDTGSGFTDYSYATLTINNKAFPVQLKGKYTDEARLAGQLNVQLTEDKLAAFSASDTQLVLAVSDVADNTATAQLLVSGHAQGQSVAIWNATNGLAFSRKSPDYDADTQIYTLKGSAQNDFYLNGKLVQVVDGRFAVPVSAMSTDPLIFSSDAQGNNVLFNWTTSTPEAEFAWQHVNGTDQNWGVVVYGIWPNSRQFTAQALVSKGENVRAFAQDYFSGTEYEATVKDGIATFSGTLPEGSNNALLVGWTEVDGPTYNDKQMTDTNNINDQSYFGVVYDATSESLPILTSADQFGVTIPNKNADPDTIGSPGDLPQHSVADLTTRADPNTSVLTFDNVVDNDFVRYGADAVTAGYYDSATQRFTVTGKVADDVVKLTILGDGSEETDEINQVKLNSDGTFTYQFKMKPTEDRGVSYIAVTDQGERVRGIFDVILDINQPTLNVPVPDANFWTIDADGNYEVYTNQPTVTISGQGDDNLDGYRMFVNDNNFYRQYHNSGVNYIADFFTNADGTVSQTDTNPYPAHDFVQTYDLVTADDQADFVPNDGDADNVFNVSLIDQVGNTVTKRIVVHYQPATVDTAVTDFKVVTPEVANELIADFRTQQASVSTLLDEGNVWENYVGSSTSDGNYYRIRDKYGNEVAALLVKQPVVPVTPEEPEENPTKTTEPKQNQGHEITTPSSQQPGEVVENTKPEEQPGKTNDTQLPTENTEQNPKPEQPLPETQPSKSEEESGVQTQAPSNETQQSDEQNQVDLTDSETKKEVDVEGQQLDGNRQSASDTVADVQKQEQKKDVLAGVSATVSDDQETTILATDLTSRLPQTDEKETSRALTWIGAVILAGLGLIGLKRRKEN
ncbi:S8 family serine peptidase [Pediococcus cellicola]|uniref:Cell-envelope associated proteinase n=1 Tax=Pediococcus cellicola TaxID=319652 RepID=A0A0R2ISL8_9LACO|nr:S8 family serine peptidase [Pediococcus cellicola]KRN65212.1 cell-envelope associated proteinase [Pediococcus cellicola]GEL15407.1 peptidase S8 [Pediococcus cellicola]